jgi:hypothetical protein
MQWCNGAIRIHTTAKPFTDFLAERYCMQAADLTIGLEYGMRHDLSNWFEV